MSFQLAAWALRQHTKTATEKIILIALADCANTHTGLCYPSIDYLAEIAMCQRRHARRSLQSLVDQKLIEIHPAPGQPHRYTFCTEGEGLQTPRVTQTPRVSMSGEGGSTDPGGEGLDDRGGGRTDPPNLEVTSNTTKKLTKKRATRFEKYEGYVDYKTAPFGWYKYGSDLGMTLETVSSEYAKFHDYWVAQPGQKGVKRDWVATWRNWLRRAGDFAPAKPIQKDDFIKRHTDTSWRHLGEDPDV